MKLYPIFFKIENKTVAVIGGGDVAARKVKDLLEAGAFVRVIAPQINKEIHDQDKADKLETIPRAYKQGDIDGANLIFAATNDPELNNNIFEEAEKKGIMINSADDPENCSFYVPSHVRKGDFILAVSTSGTSPAMAALLRRALEKSIPDNIDDILKALKEARKILFELDGLSSAQRGKVLKSLVNDNGLLTEMLKSYEKGNLEIFLKKIS